MKKHILLFLVLIMIFTLAACGGDGGGKSPSESPATAESGEKQSVDAELERLKELYDGKWINEDPYDGPFTMEVLSTTSIRMTYEASGSNVCDLFYSADDLTSISVSLSGMSLGKYSIDTHTGILSFSPNETDIFTYTKK
jgi:predicted small lipoprotein YifL